MKYFLLFTFFLLISTCNVVNKPTLVKDSAELRYIDSMSHTQCYVRYKNDLYENKYRLAIAVKIHYILPGYLSINPDVLDNSKSIIDNLNIGFEDEGIHFVLEDADWYVKTYTINDFTSHYEDYQEDKLLNIIVYTNEDGAKFNGIAAGIPGNVIGILLSKNKQTVVHEVGHALGLRHTFEKDDTNGHNSNTGDQICDTPAYNIMDHNIIRCTDSIAALYTREDLDILLKNYQSYATRDKDCRENFSPYQSLAMHWYIENYPTLFLTLR